MNLLSVRDLSRDDIEAIFELADRTQAGSTTPIRSLTGMSVAMLFFEDSTRTKVSFEKAARHLGLEVMNFSPGGSSMNKGESLSDTVRTIEATGADAIVIRHSASGTPWQVARWVEAAVINAGDGWHEHPTQALLDCYTIRRERGDLDGMHIAIVGDIKHSRVARSDVYAFTLLGANVSLVAPPTLLPPNVDSWNVDVRHDLDMVLPKSDVVYVLRLQRERQSTGLIPSLREYTAMYGLTQQRTDLLAEGAVVMHPGPMNVGVEIAPEVAAMPLALIGQQVTNGVAVRTGVLSYLLEREVG